MTECKRVLKPLLLLIVFVPLRRLFALTQRGGKLFSGFMTQLEGLINAVGFVRFKYEHEGSDLHSRNGKRKKNSLVFPMTPEVKYDTRAFRNLYDCRGKALDCRVHTSLTVENTPENRQAYLRAEYGNRPRPDAEELEAELEFWKTEEARDRCEKYRQRYPDKYERYTGNAADSADTGE